MVGTFSSMYKVFGLTFCSRREKKRLKLQCVCWTWWHVLAESPAPKRLKQEDLRSAWAVWCTVDQPELYNPVVHFGLKLMTRERVILSSGLPSAHGWDDRLAPLLLASCSHFQTSLFVSFIQFCIFFFATSRISPFLCEVKSHCIYGSWWENLKSGRDQASKTVIRCLKICIEINQPRLRGSLGR